MILQVKTWNQNVGRMGPSRVWERLTSFCWRLELPAVIRFGTHHVNLCFCLQRAFIYSLCHLILSLHLLNISQVRPTIFFKRSSLFLPISSPFFSLQIISILPSMSFLISSYLSIHFTTLYWKVIYIGNREMYNIGNREIHMRNNPIFFLISFHIIPLNFCFAVNSKMPSFKSWIVTRCVNIPHRYLINYKCTIPLPPCYKQHCNKYWCESFSLC